MIFKFLKKAPFFFGLNTVLALCLSPATQAQSAPDFVTVNGTAAYVQRIAMPPDAVLKQGASHQANLLLSAVSEVSSPSASETSPSRRFALPATFAGVLPCADCKGVAHTLTLQTDGGYRMRRIYLGKPGDPIVEVGRWTADPRGQRLALQDSAGNPLFFSARVDGVLRQLDSSGRAIRSSRTMDLRRTAKVDTVGEAVKTGPAGASTTPLQDRYWKLVELQGKPVTMLPGQEREVRITLASQQQRLVGFTGCNVLGGAYAMNGSSLQFEQLASAMRLCEPALNALERQVLMVLADTQSQRIDGEQLSLLAGERVLARFEAVDLN